MARLPRLAIAGQAHHIIQCVIPHQLLCVSDADRYMLHRCIAQAAHDQQMQLHGWCILDARFHCIATPADAQALPRMMQDIGRRYVRYYNRTHQRRGTLWDGRFRCTVIDPANVLRVMACVDALAAAPVASAALHAAPHPSVMPAVQPSVLSTAISPFAPSALPGHTALADGAVAADTTSPPDTAPAPHSSAAHYLGLCMQPELTPPAMWWELGNTPYEREAAYRALLEAARQQPHTGAAFVDAALHGWVLGSEAFVQQLQRHTSRRITKRSPGRPRRPS